jgi:hypothetical protein
MMPNPFRRLVLFLSLRDEEHAETHVHRMLNDAGVMT